MLLLRSAVWLIAGLAALPLLVVLLSLSQLDNDVWQHLSQHVLPEVLFNTLMLCAGVAIGVVWLGVSLAWLLTQYRFPGRRFFVWALILPLAIPAYVMAFVQVGLLDYTGPLQTGLRSLLGDGQWVPPVRSMGGAIYILCLSFYPYVYLLARDAFASQGARAIEVGQSLGYSPARSLWRVALPLARPWIAAGTLLALMETLSDFGAVYVLGVDTFTTAIYKAWFSLFSLSAATQLTSILILLALGLIALEQWQRGKRRYAPGAAASRLRNLPRWQGWLACAACSAVFWLAFVLPVVQLLFWVVENRWLDADQRIWGFIGHSLALALSAALLVLLLAWVLGYARAQLNDHSTKFAVQIATIGYAIPGTVLAVGVFIPIAWLDNWLLDTLQIDNVAILKGSVAALLFALCCRFLSVGLSPVVSAFERITPSQVMAARSLGSRGLSLQQRLYLPLLRGGLLTCLLLVLIDVLKELPITLMMRPFGWETLSIRIFEMTSEGMWQRAALPALVMIAAGLLPVLVLIRAGERHD